MIDTLTLSIRRVVPSMAAASTTRCIVFSLGDPQIRTAPDADVLWLEAGLPELLHGGLLDSGNIMLSMQQQGP